MTPETSASCIRDILTVLSVHLLSECPPPVLCSELIHLLERTALEDKAGSHRIKLLIYQLRNPLVSPFMAYSCMAIGQSRKCSTATYMYSLTTDPWEIISPMNHTVNCKQVLISLLLLKT